MPLKKNEIEYKKGIPQVKFKQRVLEVTVARPLCNRVSGVLRESRSKSHHNRSEKNIICMYQVLIDDD